MTTQRHPMLAVILILLFSTTTTLAQSTQQRPIKTTPPQPGIELSTTPTELRAIGLSVYLPPDTSTRTEFIAGGQSKTVVQPLDSTWVIQIFNSISRDKDLTPEAALDAIVEQRQQDLTVRTTRGRTVSVIDAFGRVDDLKFSEKSASRVYLRHTDDPEILSRSTNASIPVTGYTIVRTNPGEFVIFQIDTPAEAFPRTRNLYETIIASAQWTQRAEVDEARRFAARSAIRFMETISSEDLHAVLPDETIYIRVFNPGPTGHDSDAEEIGYQIVEIRKGQAGEVDPGRARTRWSSADREWGLLATVSARTVIPDALIDSRAIAFLSSDRQNESWSIIMEMKSGSTVQKSELLLIRRGLRLTAQTILPGEAPIVREDLLPDGEQGTFLSFVERLLLPRLVAHKSTDSGPASYDFAYYNFDPRRGGITLRQETFDNASTGGWSGTTIPFEGHAPWNTLYDRKGEIIRRTISPVEVMERTTAERLQRLWRNRNLPIQR